MLKAEIFTHPKKKKPWIKFDAVGQGASRPGNPSAIVNHQRPATDEEIKHFKAKALAEAEAAAAAKTDNGGAE